MNYFLFIYFLIYFLLYMEAGKKWLTTVDMDIAIEFEFY